MRNFHLLRIFGFIFLQKFSQGSRLLELIEKTWYYKSKNGSYYERVSDFADYVFTKEVATIKADSEEEALRIFEDSDELEEDCVLCYHCQNEHKIQDHPFLMEGTVRAIEKDF